MILKIAQSLRAFGKYTLIPSAVNRRLPSQKIQALSLMTKVEVIAKLKAAQAVCFDVDSTVIQEEGIDVLAASKGVGQAVADLTSKAMGGSVTFDVALEARLNLIKPSLQDFQLCMTNHPIAFTPGVREVIDKLQKKGVHVYLVSGGFRQMINPIADELNIPRQRIFANNVLFNSNGEYSSFDRSELTSRDGGKATVIQRLVDFYGYRPIIMIGDGATDMQARPPADAFIGFGGIVVRKAVEEGADWFVKDFQELLIEL